MSTRSRIGIVEEDGTVKSIYCHHDGYPSYNGKVLKKSYNTFDKVEKLISLGDISSLGSCIDKNEQSNVLDDEVTCAYCRDCNEDFEDVAPRTDKSVDDFISNGFEEYGYLFKDSKWHIVFYGKTELVELTDEMTSNKQL